MVNIWIRIIFAYKSHVLVVMFSCVDASRFLDLVGVIFFDTSVLHVVVVVFVAGVSWINTIKYNQENRIC